MPMNEAIIQAHGYLNAIREAIESLVNPNSSESLNDVRSNLQYNLSKWQEVKQIINAY